MRIKGPPNPIADLFRQAIAYHDAGQLDEAERLLNRVIAVTPGHSDSLHLLGIIAHRRGHQDAAADLISRAIKLRSSVPFYHANLGIVLRTQGRLEDAVKCFRKAIKLKPDFVEMLYELGVALCTLGHNDDAAKQFRKVLLQHPDHPGAYENLAIASRNLGRMEEARVAFDRAANLSPGRADLVYYSGAVRMSLGHRMEAEVLYRRAVALQPDYPDARHSLATALLLTGRLAEGWPEFEWRRRLRGKHPRSFVQPRWRGEDLSGRTLLLHAEQGIGDTIQFCRYACLFGLTTRLILEVPHPLVRLLSSLAGACLIVGEGETLPPFDFHCPLLSLPELFGTTLETIPAGIPYLHSSAEATASWRSRLANLPRPWIGLVWSGNPDYYHDAARSLRLDDLAPLLHVPGITFVSVQKGAASAQRHGSAGQMVHDWTDELADFADTAALVDALDLIISVDTAVAHLAGALGRPVWLLNRFDPDWRWLLDRDDSPWYPSLRQFRQKQPGDWGAVLFDVIAQLSAQQQRTPS
jgi:Flp pilus assembly protein TadD